MNDPDIAASWNRLLAIPQTDQRTGAVTVITNRVGIEGAVDLLGLHRLDRVEQNLVAGSPGTNPLDEDILHPIGGQERPADTLRGIGLALAQHIPHVLGIGRQPQRDDPKVAVQDISPLDHDRFILGEIAGGSRSAPLHAHRRLEPGTEP